MAIYTPGGRRRRRRPGKRKQPCGDCFDSHCIMNCGPAICPICGALLTWEHDHKADNTGLDDGPQLSARKRPPAKGRDELKDIRVRAWVTRRRKYGQYGHR